MEEAIVRREFLAALPRDECCICKEPYGAIDPDSGAPGEFAVRLPCSHVVGSACITKWLGPEGREDTCPLCREEFFEAAPAPDQSYGDESYGTVADQAVARLAEHEEWELNDLRSWLRRRLELNAPSTEDEVNEWWESGCPHFSDPEVRRWRRTCAPFIMLSNYDWLCQLGYALPPLNQSSSPAGLPTLDQMDQTHEDALFTLMRNEGWLEHPWWADTASGASPREIWDLMTQEMYFFGRAGPESLPMAPLLAGWRGIINDRTFALPLSAGLALLNNINDTIRQESEDQGHQEEADAEARRPAKSHARARPNSESDESESQASLSDDGDSVMSDAEDQRMVTREAQEEGNASDNEVYCICRRVSEGYMIACDSDNCSNEWFHWGCVGVETAPAGEWYCPECRDEALGHMGFQNQD